MASKILAAQRTWTPAQLAALRAAALKAGTPASKLAPTNLPNLGFGAWPAWSPSPPSGTYDPALDAAKEAAGRGLQDLQSDTLRSGTRDTVDYGLGREDILRSGARQTADLQTASTREAQNYDRNVGLLKRSYEIKGNNQAQQANAYGVLRGGALLQAANKRAANEAIDRQPLDTGHSQFQADNAQSLSRLGEDTNLSLGKLALMMAPPDAQNPLGGRSFQDRATTLTRGERENTQFGLDTEAQKAFQAAGTGWDPGTRPSYQHLGPTGPYRFKTVAGIRYRVDPTGKVIARRSLR